MSELRERIEALELFKDSHAHHNLIKKIANLENWSNKVPQWFTRIEKLEASSASHTERIGLLYSSPWCFDVNGRLNNQEEVLRELIHLCNAINAHMTNEYKVDKDSIKEDLFVLLKRLSVATDKVMPYANGQAGSARQTEEKCDYYQEGICTINKAAQCPENSHCTNTPIMVKKADLEELFTNKLNFNIFRKFKKKYLEEDK